MKGSHIWKKSFNGRYSSMEYNLQWKISFKIRQLSNDDDLRQKPSLLQIIIQPINPTGIKDRSKNQTGAGELCKDASASVDLF